MYPPMMLVIKKNKGNVGVTYVFVVFVIEAHIYVISSLHIPSQNLSLTQ